MIAQLREKAQELQKRQTQVIVVEVLPPHVVRYLERRAKKENKDPSPRPMDRYLDGVGRWITESGESAFPVVTDPSGTVGASYGVAFQGSLGSLGAGEYSNLPKTFVIDRDGVIRFVLHYKSTQDLGADDLLQVLDDLEHKRGHISKLKDKAPALGEIAAQALLGRETKDIARLGSALEAEKDAEVRAAAAAALCLMGFRAAAAVPFLARALKDEAPLVRRWSAEALARIGPPARPAVPALIRALNHAHAKVCWALDASLRGSSPWSSLVFPPFVSEIRHMDEHLRVRAMAIAALERIGADAVPELLEALEDADVAVRSNLAGILGRFGPQAEQIAPLLSALLKRDPDARVRRAAVQALNDLLHYHPALIKALKDADAGVRIEAAGAIERTGGLAYLNAVAALVEALEDPDVDVRITASWALDHRSDVSLPTLLEALKHEDAGVRSSAAGAISRLAALAKVRPHKSWREGGIPLTGGLLENRGLIAAARNDPDARVRTRVEEALKRIEDLKKLEDGEE